MGLEELLRGAIARDARAWEALVDRYGTLVWRILGRFRDLGEDERRDVFQDVFVALVDGGVAKFSGATEGQFRGYLKTITVNSCRTLYRERTKDRRRTIVEHTAETGDDAGPGMLEMIADAGPGPADLALTRETEAALRDCLEKTGLEDQRAFWMRHQGIDYETISRTLGISLGTVGSRINRAKTKLAACLEAVGIRDVD